jgi:hypothetical protein
VAALVLATIKAKIKERREAALGPPDDAVLADKIYEADAEWIFDVLTVQVQTLMDGLGLDSNGDTIAILTGKIL